MASKASVFERVRRVIAEQCEIDESEVTPDARFFEDLPVDSIEVELILAVEEEFGLEIPDEDAEKVMTTPGELARYIEWRIGHGA